MNNYLHKLYATRFSGTDSDSNAILGDSIAPIVVPPPIKIEEHNSGDKPTRVTTILRMRQILDDNHSQ